MRKYWWFAPQIVGNGVLWLVGVALQIGGWVNQQVAIGLLIGAGAWTVVSVIRWRRKKSTEQPSPVTSQQETRSLDISTCLTQMHKRMVELQQVRLSRKIDLRKFEQALPTLLSKLELIELGKWPTVEKSIRRRIKRVIPKKPTSKDNIYFKALDEAAKIQKEWVESKDWTLQDAVVIGQWLDGYNWGVGELRDNDEEWQQLYRLAKSYFQRDDILRGLIEKHIKLSYASSSVQVIVGYSGRHRNSTLLSMLYETLVGCPISPVDIDLALSEILQDIDKRMAVLNQSQAIELQPKPHLELFDLPYTDKRKIRDIRTGQLIGEPYFCHAKFCNKPNIRSAEANALKVFPITIFYDMSGQQIQQLNKVRFSGMAEPPFQQQTVSPKQYYEVEFNANGSPWEVTLALKYEEDDICYAFDDHCYNSPQWKKPEYLLSKGNYYVKVILSGENTQGTWWFKLRNHGRGKSIKLEVTSQPDFDKEVSPTE